MRTLHRIGTGLLLMTLAAGAAACGDDDGASDATTTTAGEPEPTTVEVTAVDYGFNGLPDTIVAGSTLTLTNDSTEELHELVAIRIPDDEDRSVADLLALPESEIDAIFGAAEPTAVLIAPPAGGEMIAAVGDGTFAEPGRYAIICSIPLGADPDEFLNAPPGDGPPDVAGGPPHFTEGMYGELTVR